MKLNSAQVQRTLDQFEASVIPDEAPVIAKLNELFGEHTFFLDQHGLNIACLRRRLRIGAKLPRRRAIFSIFLPFPLPRKIPADRS